MKMRFREGQTVAILQEASVPGAGRTTARRRGIKEVAGRNR